MCADCILAWQLRETFDQQLTPPAQASMDNKCKSKKPDCKMAQVASQAHSKMQPSPLLALLAVLIATQPATAAISHTSIEHVSYKGRSSAADGLWGRLVSNPNDSHASIIALITSRKLVEARFRHVCGQKQASETIQSVIDIPGACWSLQGACQRVYRASITGIAGRFTRNQLTALYECAGPEGIAYLTKDNQVKKAEGNDHKSWWTYRPPADMTLEQLQQLAASKLGTATAAGVASSLANASAAASTQSGTVEPQVQASDGQPQRSSTASSNVTLALIQRWVLAEVGLTAQKELSQPQIQPQAVHQEVSQPNTQPLLVVRAADQVTAVDDAAAAANSRSAAGQKPSTIHSSTAGHESAQSVPHVTAQVAAKGQAVVTSDEETAVSNQQPAASKNQDPGILVDVQAVAQPEIIVHTAGTSSRTDSNQDLQQPLSLAAAQQANREPGVKEQKLVTALWNLDRIDQQQLPLNSTFSYGSSTTPGTGQGVTIYILDSGIRASHQEFQPWDGSSVVRVTVGPDFVDNDEKADDCDGHGTHVASTAAGRSVGVAKEAHVVAVRVLDCDGAGSISNVVAALDWVAANAVKPAVVSLSLGVPAGSWSKPMEDAILHMTGTVGIPVVVASGNSAKDSCGVAPARAATAITVAASNMPTKFARTRAGDIENLYSWSNTGACVKIFAPGVDIYGACGGASRCATLDDSSYTWASGTSMAAPHVTGAVAVYLESHPTATPAQVMSALVTAASTDRITDAAMLPGTPNKLLFTRQQQLAV